QRGCSAARMPWEVCPRAASAGESGGPPSDPPVYPPRIDATAPRALHPQRRSTIGLAATWMAAAPLAFAALGIDSAAAQEPYPFLVPGGSTRLEIPGIFSSHSSLYRTSDADAALEELGGPYTGTVGPTVFPALAGFEEAVRRAGQEGYRAALGSMESFMERSQVRVPFSIDVGVFDWLTAGIVVPAVHSDVEFALDFDADSTGANAGFSPDSASVYDFLDALGSSIGEFDGHQKNVCTADPNSSECIRATAALGGAVTFQSALSAMYGTLFAPLAWSEAGGALQSRLAELDAIFEAAGVGGLPDSVPLADELMVRADFLELISNPVHGIGATTPEGRWRPGWRLGDIELRVNTRLYDSGGDADERGIEAGLGTLVRLPTAVQADPASLVDVGTGDDQMDVEVRGWLNARLGGGSGIWAGYRHGVQLGGTTIRRAFDPSVTFAPLSTQATLEWDPGDYRVVDLAPWYRVSGSLTLLAGYRHRGKGPDSFALAAAAGEDGEPSPDAPEGPPPDPKILVANSESSSGRLLLGIVYNRATTNPEDGSVGRPLEIRFTYRRVVAGSGGVPKSRSLEAGFRFYADLWRGT
ncbi:MAG: hypothetical protein OXG58_04145, partial [Gemmatimonadetes bacterium]|nr:hypothetical protein [Gemmatimonadota bacterium]